MQPSQPQLSQPPTQQQPQAVDPINLPIISKPKLRELAHVASAGERLDPAVEGVLVKMAEDFVAKVAQVSADLAKHRRSKTLEVEDVQLHLERSWDLGVPGFSTMEGRKVQRGPPAPSDGHIQRATMVTREQAKHH